ncbi:hypothetical protein AB0N14_02570 [Streptomyces sp. NPDC051104]|uniref:hypothetical protein n=1 Tax=Streptomyces sp. NPDC051104 TaxID=3155044 RepID=UPI00341756B7
MTDATPITSADLLGTASIATCADNNDEVTGGGYLVSGPLNAVNVVESRPVDSAPDAWRVSADALLPAGTTVTAYVVCARVPGV